jgi:hypothetical protein
VAYADVQKQLHAQDKRGVSPDTGMESVNHSVEHVLEQKASDKPEKMEKQSPRQKTPKVKPLEAKGKNPIKKQGEVKKNDEYQHIMRSEPLQDKQREQDNLLRDNIDLMHKKLQ